MASAAGKKKTTTRNSGRSPRSPLVLRRAMLHSSLCFLVGLLAGLVAPSDWPAAALLAPSAVFLRTLRAINNNRNIIFTSRISSRRSSSVYSPQQPQLLVVVTTTEQSQSDPERRAAGLTRTAHALRLVSPPLLWLVVEEEHAAPPTARLLRRTGVVHRHLMYKHKQKQGEERIGMMMMMREQQRNVALRHIEDHRIAGVVLFGGLADVYDLRLLHRLRDIRTFGAWPVATVSAYERKVMVQGPLCICSNSSSESEVITSGWFDFDMDMAAADRRRPATDRPPPEMLMDVGGFAFTSWLLWDPHRWDRFPLSDPDTSQLRASPLYVDLDRSVFNKSRLRVVARRTSDLVASSVVATSPSRLPRPRTSGVLASSRSDLLLRLMEMDGEGFLPSILLDGQDDHVAGLDDLITISPDAETQTSQDVDVAVVPPRRAKQGNKTRRSKNFDYKEDEVVCSGWLNASKDPLNGANQTRTTFWGRVHAYFELHKPTATDRTESSIMHRWFTIQHQVNKFCGCYEQIKRRHQSGHTVTDMVSEAHKLYEEQDKEKKKFTLIPCWNILKDQDKWAARMVELAELEKLEKSKKTEKASKVSRPRNEQEQETQATAADGQETQPRKRSDGIKKVKANLRGGGAEVCAEAIDKLLTKKEETDKEKEKAKQERFVAALEVDKENLAMEKIRAEAELKRADADQKRANAEQKRAEAELLKQEKDIMLASDSGLNPAQLQWLKMMQEDIVAKRCPPQV